MQFDSSSSETTGYHIFLEPENDLRVGIQAVINLLAKNHNGPVFTPHVTLLARILGDSDNEIITLTEQLAKEMKPFSVALTNIETRPAYFQACFLRLEDEKLVTQYHKQAKEVFGVFNSSIYLPHMSLFYGNMTESESAQLLSEIVLPNSSLEFEVSKLHVYRTPGVVGTWVKVAEVPVGLM